MNFQIPPALPALELDVFARRQPRRDPYVTKAGEQFQVIASGTTPSGRNVSWVATDEDTLVMFSSALALAYVGIARAVAGEARSARGPDVFAIGARRHAVVDMAETSATPGVGGGFLYLLSWSAPPTPPASDCLSRHRCLPDQISGTLRCHRWRKHAAAPHPSRTSQVRRRFIHHTSAGAGYKQVLRTT